jgi:proteasome lid subunit RPN8/RPN11
MRIAPDLLSLIVEHARRDAPNECCGVIAMRDGVAEAVHSMENTAASPFRFEVDGPTLARLLDKVEDGGATIGAIYHSHTRSAPYPSQTDINFAVGWPGVEWLIVGLANGDAEVRSYLIDGGAVTEVEVA